MFQSIRFYCELKDSLRRFYCLNEEKLRVFQNRQFKANLELIASSNIFYKHKFLKNKIDFKNNVQLGTITELPFSEPADFFSQQHEMQINAKSAHTTLRSSGTTGCPKNIYLSEHERFYLRRLTYLRMLFLSGCQPFSKTVFLKFSQSTLSRQAKWFWNKGFIRERIICLDQPIYEQAAIFNQTQANILYCLTADGVALAEFIKSQKMYTHKVKHIFTTGEILGKKDRQLMVEMLGKNVIDFYASTETGIIAWQCSKTPAYHVNADQFYVEIVDGEKVCKDKEEGEIVVTTLIPRSFPLIRYRIGDIAVLEHGKCECGSSFPRLTQIKGRKNDFIIDINKEKVSPYRLMIKMDAIRGVEKYQIIQQSPDLVIVRVKLINGMGSQVMNEVKMICKKLLGDKMGIEIKKDFIPAYGNKQKTIINEMTNVN